MRRRCGRGDTAGTTFIGDGMKKNRNKTMYCKHWNCCNRDEDCKAGEHCPVFSFNPDCKTTVYNQDPPSLEEEMDKIWEGK